MNTKIRLLLTLIVVAGVVLALIHFWTPTPTLTPPASTTAPLPTPTTPKPTPPSTPTPTPTPIPTPSPTSTPLPTPIDSDRDGLLDDLEMRIGTDPYKPNPNVAYAARIGLIDLEEFCKTDKKILNLIRILDNDGIQTQAEKDFVDKFSMNKAISLQLFDSSELINNIYRTNLDLVTKIVYIANKNATVIPNNLAYIMLKNIENDNQIINKIKTAEESFNILDDLEIYSLNKIESVYYLGNFTGYYSNINQDWRTNFEINDIAQAISLIEKQPIIYVGLSKEFPLRGRDTDILTYLVKANYEKSAEYPYITWALAKKASVIVDLINQKSPAVIDYQGRTPAREINFDVRNNYGTENNYLELLNKRRDQIIRVYNDNLWLIGVHPKEVLEKMSNLEINADIAILHVILPFSIISGDVLKGNWLYAVYGEELYTNPEKVVLMAFSNNLVAMEVFIQMYKDYEKGELFIINPYTGNRLYLDDLIRFYLNDLGRINAEASRDMLKLYTEGSKIFRYGYIAKTLGAESWFQQKYGLPGIVDPMYEEFRVDAAAVIGASIGVPVYTGDYKCTDGYHGLAFPIILQEDYQKLMEIDPSKIIYDPLTQTISPLITRENANYWRYLTGAVSQPYLERWRLTSFPVPYKTDQSNFQFRVIFRL